MFLGYGEISVPSVVGYDPGGHLSEEDVFLDSASPQQLKVNSRSSKTDPLGRVLWLSLEGQVMIYVQLVPLQHIWQFGIGLLDHFSNSYRVLHCLEKISYREFDWLWKKGVWMPHDIQVTVFTSGQQVQQQQ